MNHERDFGLFISLLLPGFITLLGLAHHSAQSWIGTAVPNAPSLRGFLYPTVAAIFAGLVVSTVRWLLIDTIHHWTGLKQSRWHFERLADRKQSFAIFVDVHYRYYQFYGNSMIAIVGYLTARRASIASNWELPAAASLEVIFWAGSLDTSQISPASRRIICGDCYLAILAISCWSAKRGLCGSILPCISNKFNNSLLQPSECDDWKYNGHRATASDCQNVTQSRKG